MRLISQNEAMYLRDKGYANKVFSSHTKGKKYYVEERSKAEKELLKYRKSVVITN